MKDGIFDDYLCLCVKCKKPVDPERWELGFHVHKECSGPVVLPSVDNVVVAEASQQNCWIPNSSQ